MHEIVTAPELAPPVGYAHAVVGAREDDTVTVKRLKIKRPSPFGGPRDPFAGESSVEPGPGIEPLEVGDERRVHPAMSVRRSLERVVVNARFGQCVLQAQTRLALL